MHRYICTECGAYLDPGEHCDCKRRFEEKKRDLEKLYKPGPDGQMRMLLGGQKND